MNVCRHGQEDWCHLCGVRTKFSCDVFYPENAENTDVYCNKKYIRICGACSLEIYREANCFDPEKNKKTMESCFSANLCEEVTILDGHFDRRSGVIKARSVEEECVKCPENGSPMMMRVSCCKYTVEIIDGEEIVHLIVYRDEFVTKNNPKKVPREILRGMQRFDLIVE